MKTHMDNVPIKPLSKRTLETYLKTCQLDYDVYPMDKERVELELRIEGKYSVR